VTTRRPGAARARAVRRHQPQTFVDTGIGAGSACERDTRVHMSKSDETWLLVTFVGTKRIGDSKTVVRVTPPGGQPKVVKVAIGPPARQTATHQGDLQ
jgi:hypothetical protein